jgi:transposase InsO family protein
MTAEISRLFAQHHQRYGSPRLYRELRRTGWTVSRRRVARLMRAAVLRAKAVRGRSVATRRRAKPAACWRTPCSAGARRGLIFHSDRGTEYMGAAFCAFVTRHRLEQSASVRGPSDNAPNRTQYMRYCDARRCIRRWGTGRPLPSSAVQHRTLKCQRGGARSQAILMIARFARFV